MGRRNGRGQCACSFYSHAQGQAPEIDHLLPDVYFQVGLKHNCNGG